MIEWDRTPALPLPDRETAIKIFSGHPLVSSVGEIPARIIAAANELKVRFVHFTVVQVLTPGAWYGVTDKQTPTGGSFTGRRAEACPRCPIAPNRARPHPARPQPIGSASAITVAVAVAVACDAG